MRRADLEDKNSTRKVKCDVCNQTLTPELTLSEHKIMRHPMAGDVRVMRPTILKRSRLDTNNTNGTNHLNYQCIRCSYASNNSSNLGRHLEVNRNLGVTITFDISLLFETQMALVSLCIHKLEFLLNFIALLNEKYYFEYFFSH